MPISFSATVVSNEYIANQTRETVFEVSKEFPFTFKTGQFVNVKVQEKVMRAYSIASSSSDLPQFTLCVKVIENGLGSGYIDRMQVGESVEFMGAFGHFGSKNPEKKLLMLSTGTGIAPMKAILEEEKQKNFPREVTLVFGVSSPDFASYHSCFAEYAKNFSAFSYHFFASKPPENFEGNVGRITEYIKNLSPEDLENTEILICGNPAMVKEAKNLLLEKGVEKSDIIVEAF